MLCDPTLTRAIPERFREMSRYKALYKSTDTFLYYIIANTRCLRPHACTILLCFDLKMLFPIVFALKISEV